ncbi:MAG: iron ABC transporter permease [Oligoflexia bacterium]|nr:iron ABC transporter permease [Oligoflexia bacterium]
MSKKFYLPVAAILLFAGAGVVCSICSILGPKIINPLDRNLSSIDREIFFFIRLPRVCVGFLVGMGLATAGSILQSILRNPLADPFILGISSGASLFAVLALFLSNTFFILPVLPLFAFIGAITVSATVCLWSWREGTLHPEKLLLVGIGLSFFLQSLLMLLLNFIPSDTIRRASMWISGDISSADWELIPYAGFLIFLGMSVALLKTKAIQAMMLGDEIALGLGVNVHRERLFLIIAMSLMTAAAVSLSGIIGFIGLIIPHLARFLFRKIFSSHSYPPCLRSLLLLPFTAFVGGIFLTFADLVGRTILSPMEIPAGIITSLIGAPYFLYLLRKKNGNLSIF